jgi:hypothetical protein
MKQAYTSPTVTRMGSVVEKTEGGISLEAIEIMSYRKSRPN